MHFREHLIGIPPSLCFPSYVLLAVSVSLGWFHIEGLTSVCLTDADTNGTQSLLRDYWGLLQIKMSSPEAFVWMALHFYQSLLEPVWPRRSRNACIQAHLRRSDVGHSGQRSTVKAVKGFCHTVSLSSYSLLFCFLSVHLLFIRQLRALDFPQTLAISGRHTNSASGLLLNRLSSDNRFHVQAVIEKAFKNKL